MTNQFPHVKCKLGKLKNRINTFFFFYCFCVKFHFLFIFLFFFQRFVAAIEAMLEKDISDNRSIGEHGAKAILSNVMDGEQVRVLTHCNTGSLATAYFGTALGVVRCLHSSSRLGKIFN